MDNHFFNSLLLLWLCCVCFVIVNTYAINCTSHEREALIAFKQSLTDPSARISSWVGENCCEWHGVTCNFISGKVTKIDLRNSLGFANYTSSFLIDGVRLIFVDYPLEYKKSCLGGEINPSLLELKYLNYLDLSLNNFERAPIPSFFGMLKNLRYLNLASAHFNGEVPPHLGNLSSLKYLDLSAYDQVEVEGRLTPQLRVENLQWLSSLSSLEYLDIGAMNLSSVQANWMTVVNRLSLLSELRMSECHIHRFDSSIGFQNLTSLRVLHLQWNWINSSLPLGLSNLTSLTTLDLSSNYFQGTIHQNFVKLENLQYLDLSFNYLRNIGDHKSGCLLNLCKLQFLYLVANHIGGTLDDLLGSSSNCSHNSLEVLALRHNELVGEMPNSLETLENLLYLDLSYNKLWGSLPNSIGNLFLLQDLSVSNNLLNGTIPSLGTLKNLRSIYLSDNKLWGSLPNSIGNLSSLKYLDVSNNLLNGTIPPSFGQLSELNEFSSNGNLWEAVITEDQLVNLTKLESLQISTYKNQSLVFNVSYDWIPPFRLKTLHLRKCIIGPQFPIWLQVQTQLAGDVIISEAGIRGPIPNEWLSNVSSKITSLDLSYNLLEGELSHLLASQDPNYDLHEDSTPLRYPNLYFLYLQGNSLSGSIPSNIGDLMPHLKELYLSENHLNGTIPSSIQNMSDLQIISLSDNQLSGELLEYSWGTFRSLSVIDLAKNSLSGKIPSSIGVLTSLNTLILSNNHLHGEIPKFLHNCSNLNSIDLSGNGLYGGLPLWIGVVVSKLWLLNLRSNNFNGTIPRQWCNLPSIRVFDLSDNNISGEIPSCLNNLKTLVNDKSSDGSYYINHFGGYGYHYATEKTTLVMKGREDEYGANLNCVLTIDLSRNKLSGKIPKEITNLRRLVTLNLSNNDLVGTIPKNIGAMQQLESLDLSCNHLSGKIPTSIGSLNFLAHLNLSFNNLTGRIPTGKQLQTLNDPSIYEGNPLQIESSGDEDAGNNNVPTWTSKEDGKENDSEMFGIFISMAIGFPVGLNIWFFTIFTSESRRIFYLRFIDRVSYNILEKIGFVVSFIRKIRGRRS